MPRVHAYKPVGSEGQDDACPDLTIGKSRDGMEKAHRHTRYCLVLGFIVTLVVGFASGLLAAHSLNIDNTRSTHFKDTASRIPLSYIRGEFNYNNSFTKEPPQGPGSSRQSEPVWDSLLPSEFTRRLNLLCATLIQLLTFGLLDGLGFIVDEALAPNVTIPTVFHQLHCLYTLRRVYYSKEALEKFRLGKDPASAASHIAHCFDYLRQGLICSADTTLEVAFDEEHGFVGSGFGRQCRDFEALKAFVEDRRYFNATGFFHHELDRPEDMSR